MHGGEVLDLTHQTFWHYQIEKKLGEDSEGRTFLAHDQRSGRSVFLRIISPDLSRTQKDRLLYVCRAAARIDHPNVAKVYEIGELGDQPFVAAEYLDWLDLDQLLDRRGFSTEEVVGVGLQLTNALAELHHADILFRCLTPASIRVNKNLQVKLFDLALSQSPIIGTGLTFAASLDWDRIVPYAAPEVLEGTSQSTSGDLYSLGVVLFQMATGRLPYQRETAIELVDAVLRDPVPIARTYKPGLAPELNEIIDGLLQKDPSRRIATAETLLEALKKIPRAERIPLVQRTWQFAEEYLREAGRKARSVVDSVLGDIGVMTKSPPQTDPATKSAPPTEDSSAGEAPSGAGVVEEERVRMRRFVNAWFEGKDQIPPLSMNYWYSFKLNIGALRSSDTTTAAEFSEPDFGGQEELKLIVSLFSSDFEIRSDGRRLELVLPRMGDAKIVETEVRPTHDGVCKLEIIISLAKELEVLQVLDAAIQVVAEPVTALVES